MWYNTEFTVPPITYPHSRPKLSSEQNQAVRLMLQFTGILKDRGTKETILRRNAQIEDLEHSGFLKSQCSLVKQNNNRKSVKMF